MRSWKVKGGCTKPSRWFSWNEAAAENLSEFTASRMVLEWYLGSEQGPDDINQPQLCFKEAAGLKTGLSGPFMGDLGERTHYCTAAGALLGLLQCTTPQHQNCRGRFDRDKVHEHWLEPALEFERNCGNHGFRGALG